VATLDATHSTAIGFEALLPDQVTELSCGTAAALARGETSARDAGLIFAATDSLARVHAAASPTFLRVGADHALTRIDAITVVTQLPLGAVHVFARWIHTVTVGAAHRVRGTGELAAVARSNADSTFANLIGLAQLAIIDRSVAVVIETVAAFVRGRDAGFTGDHSVVALGQPSTAHAELLRITRLAAAGAGNTLHADDQIREIVVSPGK